MTERYKEVLERAKETKLEVLTVWYTFQMRQDPFLSPISPENFAYFINREEVLEEIIFQIGVAKRGIPITMLLVGPKGSGKTSILKQVEYILKKLDEDESEKYDFKGSFFSADELFSLPDETDEEIRTHPWISKAREERDYLLIDDAKVEHVRTINREFIHTNFKLYTISPFSYDAIIEILPFTPQIEFIRSLEFDDSIGMLERRLDISAIDPENVISLENLLEKEALKIAWECSMGIPYLFLRNISKCLELLVELKEDKVSTDIATRACKATKCFQTKQRIPRITETQKELLEEILDRGRTPTELSSILQKDRTTISRQLNEMKKVGIVEVKHRGRRSIYKVTEPAYIALEVKAMPKEVMIWRS